MSSLRHGGATAMARVGFPDSIRSIVIGHTRAIGQRAMAVDNKLSCYSRRLLITIEELLKVARFFAYPGQYSYVFIYF